MRTPVLIIVLAVAGPASAQIAPIFTTVQTSPTSDVPGQGGLKFDATTIAFDRPFVSQNGNRWIISALNTSSSIADDEMIIIGGGPTAAGAVMAVREGGAVPFEGGSTWGTFSTYAAINNTGQYAFSADVQPGTTLDQAVVRFNGTAFEQLARDGQQAAGLTGGVLYGATLDGVQILNTGEVAFRAALSPTTNGSAALTLSTATAGTVIVQSGAVPGGQLATSGAPIAATTTALATDRVLTDATGANVLYRATLGSPAVAANDTVVVFNGTVVAQEGAVLPNSGFASPVSATLVTLSGNMVLSPSGGHYLVRGANADGQDWVSRNGAVVAQTDAPIFTGSTLAWDDTVFAATFFLNTVGNDGSSVVGGLTNDPDPARDAVLVLNGATILVRENDFVAFDVDGNGTVDAGEGRFIITFNNDDAFLTATHFYFTAALSPTLGGVADSQAFLVVPVPEPAAVLLLALPLAAARRRRRATSAAGAARE